MSVIVVVGGGGRLCLPREGTKTDLEAETEKYEECWWDKVPNSERTRADWLCLHTEQLQVAASEVDRGGQAQPAQAEEQGGQAPALPPTEVVAGDAGQGLA